MAEVPLAGAWPAVVSVLSATHYGIAWLIGAAALVVVGWTSLLAPARQATGPANAVRMLALGVFLYSRSMVSHAGAAGDFTWAVAADWVHLVLVSVWVGEVIVAGLLVLDRAPSGNSVSREDCARYIRQLSHSATIALAGIVVTGAIGAWRGLGALENVAGTPYGTTLLVKIALVLGAAASGGVNRFVVMPGLLEGLRTAPGADLRARQRFAAVIKAEALVLLAVVVAAAFLSSTPPATA
jgi:putative copper resistance protein D